MGKELVVHDDIDSDIRLAKALAQSGFYKDIRDTAAGVVKLRIAREMGLGLRGISDIHIVEGKPTLSYQLILSRVRMFTGPLGTDRYSFRYTRRDEECVEIEWLINGEVIGTSKWDKEDAKRASLDGRGNWRKYPRQMLTARAVTEGVNAFMPEVIGGSIYTPDELGSGGGDDVVIVADEGGGRDTILVASSQAAPAPSLTLKPAEVTDTHEDVVVSTNDRVENMITEAVETMDAAEETLDGEVIDQSADWIAAIKQHFSTLPPEQKKAAVAMLRAGGYLPEEKMTAAKMYELLADVLGARSFEIDLILNELA